VQRFLQRGKIGRRGFVWFAFLAISRHRSLLDMKGRFFEKQDANAVAEVRRCANACDSLSSSCLDIEGTINYRNNFYG
jgi:hypothetical protein